MGVCVLGPLRVTGPAGELRVGGPKERVVLTVLTAHTGQTVRPAELVDACWPVRPPPTAKRTLQVYITRVRKLLTAVSPKIELHSLAEGWRLDIPTASLDAAHFEELVGNGRRALVTGSWSIADQLLEQGLALWRGAAYGEFDNLEVCRQEANRLNRLRDEAVTARATALLGVGATERCIAFLETEIAAQPLVEARWELLVRAHYMAGRPAAALIAFERARRVLRDEVGTDPGRELRRLHEAVLRDDASALQLGTHELPTFRGPVVGREAERRHLRDAWSHGGRVLLYGPHGSGKTRLLSDLGAWVTVTGARVQYVSGLPDSDDGADLVLVDDLQAPFVPELAHAWLVVGAYSTEGFDSSVGSSADFAVALGPWTALDVAAIVELYTGAEPTPMLVESILRRSGGVAGRAHQLAAEHARAARTLEMRETLGRVGAERGRLGELRTELHAQMLAEHRLRARTLSLPASAQSGAVPYKGLAAFAETDEALFHGRDELLATLLVRLAESAAFVVTGPSGVGKSSLLQAGLLPALRAGTLPSSETWSITQTTPSAWDTFETDLLVLDQAEELLNEPAALHALRDRLERGGRTVVCVRSDFLAELPLQDLVAAGPVLVPPLTPAQLRSAVVDPAVILGIPVEPAVVDAVIKDVGQQTRALPLASAALLETFEATHRTGLTLAAYHQIGGVGGAVAELAEQAFAELTTDQQRTARTMWLRMVTRDDQGRLARRRTTDAWPGADAFVRRRLLTASEAGVEVTHEAVFGAWPRLANWLAEDVEGLRVRAHLTPAIASWIADGRPDADLYRGTRLESALEWAAREEPEPAERDFLDASARAVHREQQRLRSLAVGLIVVLIATLVAALLAVTSARRAHTQAATANAERIGALALTEPRRDRALLLATEAVALRPSPDEIADLLATLLAEPNTTRVIVPSGNRLEDIALRPDGRQFAVADNRGLVSLVDATTLRTTQTIDSGSHNVIGSVAYSPNGSEVAAAGPLLNGDGVVEVWDVKTGRRIAREQVGDVGDLIWSSDGSHLAASGPSSVYLISLSSPSVRTVTMGAPYPISYSPDGQQLLITTVGGVVAWYDSTSGRLVRQVADLRTPHAVQGAADLSRDGSTLAMGTSDGSISLLNASDGSVEHVLTGPRSSIDRLRFAQGGLITATADDGSATAWDVDTGRQVWALAARSGVLSQALLPDGHTLLLAGQDGTLREERLDTEILRAAVPVADGKATTAAWRPDGLALALGTTDGSVIMTDKQLSSSSHTPVAAGSIQATAWSPDSARLAVGASSDTTVLDAAGRVIRRAHWPAAVTALRFTHDGAQVIVATLQGAELWSVADGAIHPVLIGSEVDSVDVFGNLAAFGSANGDAILIDLVGGARHSIHINPDPVAPAVAFDPQRQALITGARDGSIQFWDVRTRSARGPAEPNSASGVGEILAGDSRWAVALDYNGAVTLWDAAARSRLGPLGSGTASSAALSPSGSQLVTVDAAGDPRVWDLHENDWVTSACRIAGRQLTAQEWKQVLPGRAYRPAC